MKKTLVAYFSTSGITKNKAEIIKGKILNGSISEKEIKEIV